MPPLRHVSISSTHVQHPSAAAQQLAQRSRIALVGALVVDLKELEMLQNLRLSIENHIILIILYHFMSFHVIVIAISLSTTE